MIQWADENLEDFGMPELEDDNFDLNINLKNSESVGDGIGGEF